MYYTSREVYQHLSTQNNDPIVERKTCSVSWVEFAIFQSDLDFYKKISPTFAWVTFQIPTPTLCPEERRRRRLLQRNGRHYFKSTCSLSWKQIITNIDPELNVQIYDKSVRWSDVRDARDYWRVYIPKKTFFEQYKELKASVPKIALMNDNNIWSENCEYTYDILYCKDCYMTIEAIQNKRAHYSLCVHRCEDITDSTILYDSTRCIECTDSFSLYNCFYVQNSESCSNMIYARDCKGCSDCIWCVWLRNKKYCIFNKQVTKEEYLTYQTAFKKRIFSRDSSLETERLSFLAWFPKRALHSVSSERSTGNNLHNCSNIVLSYDLTWCSDSKYLSNVVDNSHHCMDIDISFELNYCYEWVTPDMSTNCLFTIFCSSCSNIYYSEMCHRCHHCFWCIWLKDKKYCIFNKQYTKEQYEHLLCEIIPSMKEHNERGEFFPYWTSDFCYNTSDAYQRLPLSQKHAEERWHMRNTKDINVNIPKNAKVVYVHDLTWNPHNIEDVVTRQVLICKDSGRPYRIIQSELEFYRSINAPVPHSHPDVRHTKRMSRRVKRETHLRNCITCKKTVLSCYSKDDAKEVYCESCNN